MVEFIYNNANNANSSHIPFKANCGYHPHVLFENDADLHSKSQSAEELVKELRDLMSIYH